MYRCMDVSMYVCIFVWMYICVYMPEVMRAYATVFNTTLRRILASGRPVSEREAEREREKGERERERKGERERERKREGHGEREGGGGGGLQRGDRDNHRLHNSFVT